MDAEETNSSILFSLSLRVRRRESWKRRTINILRRNLSISNNREKERVFNQGDYMISNIGKWDSNSKYNASAWSELGV